jgi:gluconate 5-dehydrogenase
MINNIVNKFNLDKKIALITGSSRGLGLVMAKGLASAGATIILNCRRKNEEKLNQVVEQFKRDGIKSVHGYAFDITKKNDISRQVQKIEKEVGPIDILVNNAGVQRRKPLEELEEATWREVIETNLTGSFLTSQQVVQGMIKRKSGKIVNICSLMSEIGRDSISAYSASKGGLKMLTKNMAVEWAKYNIQINGIGPGYFITDMTRALVDKKEFNQWIINRTPAQRWGNPEELIGALIFLSSEASDFINGQIIYVDGGILAGI